MIHDPIPALMEEDKRHAARGSSPSEPSRNTQSSIIACLIGTRSSVLCNTVLVCVDGTAWTMDLVRTYSSYLDLILRRTYSGSLHYKI
jgi:hypothetical protein